MNINELYRPLNVQDAYEKLLDRKKAVLMAGGMFLRLQKRTMPLVIDLDPLRLNQITAAHGQFRIGSMTTLRALETHPQLPKLLKDSVRQIAGVGVRNMSTIGGSVMGRYSFSDVNTALLALCASLQFYMAGEISVEAYLKEGLKEPDILLSVTIPKEVEGLFRAYKMTYTDFSLINLAVADIHGQMRVTIGARPGRSRLVLGGLEASADAVEDLLNQFDFGSDSRASADYRRALTRALLSDACTEVSSWK